MSGPEITKPGLQASNLWPRYPYLTVKQKSKFVVGVMVADEEHEKALVGQGEFVIYHVNIFMLPKDEAAWERAPQNRYKTFEALIKDGWVLD